MSTPLRLLIIIAAMAVGGLMTYEVGDWLYFEPAQPSGDGPGARMGRALVLVLFIVPAGTLISGLIATAATQHKRQTKQGQ